MITIGAARIRQILVQFTDQLAYGQFQVEFSGGLEDGIQIP